MKLELYRPEEDPERKKLPLFTARISAGFPSPADDYIDKKLDLNEYLIKNPAATFFVRVQGDSMKGAGINDCDMLVVDRSVEVKSGSVVVAALNGELVVKRVRKVRNKVCLMPENPDYKPIEVGEEEDLTVWGVVTAVIHKV